MTNEGLRRALCMMGREFAEVRPGGDPAAMSMQAGAWRGAGTPLERAIIWRPERTSEEGPRGTGEDDGAVSGARNGLDPFLCVASSATAVNNA